MDNVISLSPPDIQARAAARRRRATLVAQGRSDDAPIRLEPLKADVPLLPGEEAHLSVTGLWASIAADNTLSGVRAAIAGSRHATVRVRGRAPEFPNQKLKLSARQAMLHVTTKRTIFARAGVILRAYEHAEIRKRAFYSDAIVLHGVGGECNVLFADRHTVDLADVIYQAFG